MKMKLSQKICISSLLFFLLVYLVSGVWIIENNKNTAVNRTLQLSADEQNGISSGMIRYILVNRAKNTSRIKIDDSVYITEYLDSRMNSGGVYLAVFKQDTVLYSNLAFKLSDIGSFDYAGKTTWRIQQIEDRPYVALLSHLPLEEEGLWSIYLRDISDIYADRTSQYTFFVQLGLAVTLTLAVGLFFITRHLTRSLRLLTDAVQKAGMGNYKERIHIKAMDETATLADSYNEMAGAIEQNIQKLEDKTKEQQRFIDNFTHELRTPLTAIVGYADLLRSTSCDEDMYQRWGERIFREGKRIEALSRSMMDLIFLQRHSFDLTPCEIGPVLLEAAETFEPAAAGAGIQLICIPPDSTALVSGDRHLLLILIGNLLDNAKKASDKGKTIRLRGRIEENQVVIEVEDQGKGIPASDRDRIFESFYMVDKVRNHKNTGIGLGLSICADIASIHNARILVTSEEGTGTLFQIFFPGYKQDTKQRYDNNCNKKYESSGGQNK